MIEAFFGLIMLIIIVFAARLLDIRMTDKILLVSGYVIIVIPSLLTVDLLNWMQVIEALFWNAWAIAYVIVYLITFATVKIVKHARHSHTFHSNGKTKITRIAKIKELRNKLLNEQLAALNKFKIRKGELNDG
ncbi:MAG: hypothetical protein ACTSVY_07390 [Candidatus Helarchaeota archaeon]